MPKKPYDPADLMAKGEPKNSRHDLSQILPTVAPQSDNAPGKLGSATPQCWVPIPTNPQD